MDDPQPSLFYDPQQDTTTKEKSDAAPGGVQPAGFEELQPIAQPAPQPQPPGVETFVSPRSPVTAVPLEQLGLIVVSGNNPQDVEAMIKFIQWVADNVPSTEFQVEMIPLAKADATSVANTLTQLFKQVNVNPAGNTQNSTTKKTTQTQQGTVTEEAAVVGRADPGASAERPVGGGAEVSHEGRGKAHQESGRGQLAGRPDDGLPSQEGVGGPRRHADNQLLQPALFRGQRNRQPAPDRASPSTPAPTSSSSRPPRRTWRRSAT